MRNAKSILMLMLCAVFLLTPIIAQAQEDSGEAHSDTSAEVQSEADSGDSHDGEIADDEAHGDNEAESPEGTGLLMLLLGVGGVFVVGIATIGRENNVTLPGQDAQG